MSSFLLQPFDLRGRLAEVEANMEAERRRTRRIQRGYAADAAALHRSRSMGHLLPGAGYQDQYRNTIHDSLPRRRHQYHHPGHHHHHHHHHRRGHHHGYRSRSLGRSLPPVENNIFLSSSGAAASSAMNGHDNSLSALLVDRPLAHGSVSATTARKVSSGYKITY